MRALERMTECRQVVLSMSRMSVRVKANSTCSLRLLVDRWDAGESTVASTAVQCWDVRTDDSIERQILIFTCSCTRLVDCVVRSLLSTVFSASVPSCCSVHVIQCCPAPVLERPHDRSPHHGSDTDEWSGHWRRRTRGREYDFCSSLHSKPTRNSQ